MTAGMPIEPGCMGTTMTDSNRESFPLLDLHLLRVEDTRDAIQDGKPGSLSHHGYTSWVRDQNAHTYLLLGLRKAIDECRASLHLDRSAVLAQFDRLLDDRQ